MNTQEQIVNRIQKNLVEAKELLVEIKTTVMTFKVSSDSLPEHLRGKRSSRSLSSLDRATIPVVRDPRSVSVKFDGDQNPTKFTPERMAAIEMYRQQAERNEAIQFQSNDDKLYARELAFALMVLSPSEFE